MANTLKKTESNRRTGNTDHLKADMARTRDTLTRKKTGHLQSFNCLPSSSFTSFVCKSGLACVVLSSSIHNLLSSNIPLTKEISTLSIILKESRQHRHVAIYLVEIKSFGPLDVLSVEYIHALIILLTGPGDGNPQLQSHIWAL